MRGNAGDDRKGHEGQGEVITVTARPVPLSRLDESEEMLQSGFWASFKQAEGWKPHAFAVEISGDGLAATYSLLALTRSFLRLFSIAYIPFGPPLDPGSGRGAMLSSLARALRVGLPGSTFLLRFDLPWLRGGEDPCHRGRPRVLKCGFDIQPASTVVVDIAREPEGILASMKHKTRYNIRLAARKGVSVEEGGIGDLDRWYALYQETSRRDRIAIHSRAYYRTLLASASEYRGARPTVKLLLAFHEGELLAGNIVAFWRNHAVYLYGASSGEKRNLMPTYALQWEAMRLAREAGCERYDLYGVPPQPDPRHPMHGLYQFKTGFADQVLERWGTWDVPLRPLLYRCYRAAEAARMFRHRTLKKRRGERTGSATSSSS
jgi:lipid II:glycine glycyltransferase (peptidoglycan interpeptide bridge formation enzyme)